MKNSEIIKKYLDYGFKVLVKDLKDEENPYSVVCFYDKEGFYIGSWESTVKEAKGSPWGSTEEFNVFDRDGDYPATELTPVVEKPKRFKPGDLVDIAEEYREVLRIGTHSLNCMIGDVGLEVEKYDVESHSYLIYQKDKTSCWSFPAWCVLPHIQEREKVDTIVIGGIKYDKKEVEERLKNIKPIQ